MKPNSCQDARLPGPLTTTVHTQLCQCNNKSKRETTRDCFAITRWKHHTILKHTTVAQQEKQLGVPQETQAYCQGESIQPFSVYKWIQEVFDLHLAGRSA